MDAVESILVMQMRPGRTTRHADITDHVALLDPVADAVAAKARHMGI